MPIEVGTDFPDETGRMIMSQSSSPADVRRAPRSRWPWALQAVLAVAALFAALYASAVFLLIPGLETLNEPSTPFMEAVAVAVLVAMHLMTLLVALGSVAVLARLDGRRRLRDVGWRFDRRSLPLLCAGILISAVVLVAVGAPLGAAGMLRSQEVGIAGIPVWQVLVVGLSQAFLLQAIPEELIFRGYLLGSLRMRPLPAVLVSGLVFAVLHLTSSGGQQGWGERLMYLVMPLGFGLAAGALMLLAGSLWVAIGIHAGLHVTLLAATLLARVDPVYAIGNGPALWLLCGLAWMAVAAVAMVVLARRTKANDGRRQSSSSPRRRRAQARGSHCEPADKWLAVALAEVTSHPAVSAVVSTGAGQHDEVRGDAGEELCSKWGH